jgi:hypothetical protein
VCQTVFSYLNFFVRHSITDTRIELIQRLPGQLGIRQVLRRLDCAFEGGRPNLAQKVTHLRRRYRKKDWAATDGQRRIANIVFDEIR